MAIKLVNEEWCATQNDYIQYYVVDTEDDVSTLPVCCVGSSALVSNAGTVYVVNASGSWVKFGG